MPRDPRHYYYARGEYLTAARQFERARRRGGARPEGDPAAVPARPRAPRRPRGGLADACSRECSSRIPVRRGAARARRAMALQGKAERAAAIYREIAEHGTADPLTPLWRSPSSMRVADALGRPADARSAAATLAREYPQSSEAAAARERLRHETPAAEPAPRPAPAGRKASGPRRLRRPRPWSRAPAPGRRRRSLPRRRPPLTRR